MSVLGEGSPCQSLLFPTGSSNRLTASSFLEQSKLHAQTLLSSRLFCPYPVSWSGRGLQ